jgi:hypothetical protein
MIGLLLLVAALGSGSPTTSLSPCIPVASDRLQPTTSGIEDHKRLRQELNEPMPEDRPMVMIYGRGGHLSTEEYSIIVARSSDGLWRGTAVGRSRIWVKDAPYTSMKRADWILDKASAGGLDGAISRTCPFNRAAESGSKAGPPPRGYISEKIDVVSEGRNVHSFYVGEGGEAIAALIRPPR